MKKLVGVLGLVVLVMAGVSYVFAGGPGFGPGSRGGNGPGSCPGFMGVSNLTSEQEAKLQELRQAHHNEVAPLKDKMFSLRQELRTLWADPNAEPETIQEKEARMNELREQMRDKAVAFKLQVRGLLTAEQISSFGSGCGQGGRGRGPF